MKKLLFILLLFALIYYLLSDFTESFIGNYTLPKIIYAYWDDLDKNNIIKSHINTWKRKIPKDWQIHLINKNNIARYVSVDFIKRYSNLGSTRFSDFLRLELLSKTGGVWMDASIFITDGSFIDTYYDQMQKYKFDVLLYELTVKTIDKNIPYLENWFIMAPKESKLIADLYKEFDKAYEMGFYDYKMKVLIPSGVNLDGTIGYNERTYLMQHAIINYLMHIGNKYKVNIKDSYDSMFKIHKLNDWDHKKIIPAIIQNKNWESYYAIKLSKPTRQFITKENELKYISTLEQL